ncbi:hypothetical protein MF672_027465 [Actinomadura sp. ATCC 31491]|uniref:Uncharacterized protein n=1 Tax=Actinomadura luzonensis TaxID=2805427 RepID=A0ABT0G035_9ACTN|nr:hypothetical protein [Actinomadura luzonensis]MCK2217501.1 hypothetical protein [Actinomadura luzonensis]
MRIRLSALVAGVLVSVLLSGTAHAATAAPAYKPALTKSPIYRSGELDLGTC